MMVEENKNKERTKGKKKKKERKNKRGEEEGREGKKRVKIFEISAKGGPVK